MRVGFMILISFGMIGSCVGLCDSFCKGVYCVESAFEWRKPVRRVKRNFSSNSWISQPLNC